LVARAEKKAAKKAERERARLELAQDAAAMEVDGDGDMMNTMGFSGFGSTKKIMRMISFSSSTLRGTLLYV